MPHQSLVSKSRYNSPSALSAFQNRNYCHMCTTFNIFFRFAVPERLIYYTLTRNINTTLRLHTKSLIDRYESKDTGGESHETRAEATTSAAAQPNQPTKHPRRTSVTVVSEAHRGHSTYRHGRTPHSILLIYEYYTNTLHLHLFTITHCWLVSQWYWLWPKNVSRRNIITCRLNRRLLHSKVASGVSRISSRRGPNFGPRVPPSKTENSSDLLHYFFWGGGRQIHN